MEGEVPEQRKRKLQERTSGMSQNEVGMKKLKGETHGQSQTEKTNSVMEKVDKDANGQSQDSEFGRVNMEVERDDGECTEKLETETAEKCQNLDSAPEKNLDSALDTMETETDEKCQNLDSALEKMETDIDEKSAEKLEKETDGTEMDTKTEIETETERNAGTETESETKEESAKPGTTYKCRYCTERLFTRDHVKDHMRRAHMDMAPTKFREEFMDSRTDPSGDSSSKSIPSVNQELKSDSSELPSENQESNSGPSSENHASQSDPSSGNHASQSDHSSSDDSEKSVSRNKP